MKYYMADGSGAINLHCKIDAGLNGVIADTEIAIHEVRLHLSAASAAEDFVVKAECPLDGRYDAVFTTKAMNALTDYNYQPYFPHYLRTGDDLVITKANAAGLTWSVCVVYE